MNRLSSESVSPIVRARCDGARGGRPAPAPGPVPFQRADAFGSTRRRERLALGAPSPTRRRTMRPLLIKSPRHRPSIHPFMHMCVCVCACMYVCVYTRISYATARDTCFIHVHACCVHDDMIARYSPLQAHRSTSLVFDPAILKR